MKYYQVAVKIDNVVKALHPRLADKIFDEVGKRASEDPLLDWDVISIASEIIFIELNSLTYHKKELRKHPAYLFFDSKQRLDPFTRSNVHVWLDHFNILFIPYIKTLLGIKDEG